MTNEGGLGPGLYLVSVPIGAARDITLRALDVLRDAEVLAAEDTRALRRLMDIHGVALGSRRIIAYHDANGAKVRPRLLAELNAGRSLAYASEAGTPLVADPGFPLVREAIAAGVAVTAAPGAVAAIMALTLSGLPSDIFTFAGFLPSAARARQTALARLKTAPGTLIFYESPRRLGAMLGDAREVLGDREAAVCRELTKRFEEVRRGSLAELAEGYSGEPPKGECVVCIGPGGGEDADPEEVEAALAEALTTLRLKEAARQVADRFGLSAREVYQMGLGMKGD